MKSKTKFISASVCAALSAVTSLMFCGYRIGFVFVDHEVHFDGFCYLLWALFIANTVCLAFQLRSVLKSRKVFNMPVFIINMIITVLNLGAAIAFACFSPDEIPNFILMAPELLPYLGAFYMLLFLVLIFPYCHRLFRKITAIALALCIVASAVIFMFPAGGFKIESAPAVFDTGDGYRVVFATNRESVGCVTYDYNGESYTVWDTVTGHKDASTVHSILVPYEHLNNNKYSVRAVRSLEDIAYGGHLGKEISMDIDAFTPCPEDGFNMLVITDNHGAQPDWAKLSGKGDIIAFLGDIANGIYSYDSFVDNLIVPAGIMTAGRAPVIYARGNHDHRGNFVPELLSQLDFSEYYFRIRNGKYTFTIFDTGEDKVDDNYEYGGYAAFESYKAEQLDWAKSLPKEEGYNIVLAHSRTIFDQTDEQAAEIAEVVKAFGADAVICGHSHRTEYKTAEENEDIGIQSYVCGSRDGQKDVKYTVISFNGGALHAVSERLSNGEVLCEADMTLTETK